jgi:hypothetical protein
MVSLTLTNDELFVLERDIDMIRSSLERELHRVITTTDFKSLSEDEEHIVRKFTDNIIKGLTIYQELTYKLEGLRRTKDE